MGSRIDGISGSERTRRLLHERSEELRSSFRRLASGRRIGEAADDAAGLGIGERMRAELRSLSQASRNTQAGIDLARTADAGLEEVGGNLARLRELAVAASNGTLSAEDRATLQVEFEALTAEIDGAAAGTEVGGVALLDGSPGPELLTGTDGGETVAVPSFDASAAGLAIDALSVADAADAETALGALDGALDAVADARGSFGAFVRELEAHQRGLIAERESLASAEARVSSLDVALESAQLANQRLLADAGVASLVQANVGAERALRLLA